MRHRYENFGGIVASDQPPFLAFVDRQYMRDLGLPPSRRWDGAEETVGVLSAPVEVHFACTNRCSLGCNHCYMDAGEADAGELETGEFKAALHALAKMGVFHVALGGGEALERKDLFELAAHAREVGLTPNLTSSGQGIDPETAAKLIAFGQVNLSLDGAGAAAATFRSAADFHAVDRSFGHLLAAGVSTGINCVVGRRNVEALPALFAYAASRGLSEIELLRYKPSGRGAEGYREERMTASQAREFLPQVQDLSERHEIRAKIDCSFLPMLCYHRPPRELLEQLGVCGCEAGNYLVGVRSDGSVSGCSFLPALGLKLEELPDLWETHAGLQDLRGWYRTAPEPCASCSYLDLCRGGCRAVALAETGSDDAPDPGCPWVEGFRTGEGTT